MRTIDEAITHAREVASEQKRRSGECVINDNECDKFSNCIQCAEEHEQLAEWLEELKAYRNLHEQDKKVYNKAIDDFVERLNEKCDAMIKEKWNSNVAPISWAEAYSDFKDDIDEIAEQLKAGEENE